MRAPALALAATALAAAPASTITVLSTSYCAAEGSLTASGEHVRPGIVAVRDYSIPFGTSVVVNSRPLPFGRRVWTVEDHMAEYDAASLDWFASSCTQSDEWGARTVRVRFIYPRRNRP